MNPVKLFARTASGDYVPVLVASDGTLLTSTAATKITDGTNFMPTGDTQARAVQVTPGDGTNPIYAAAAASADAKANPTAGLVQSLAQAFNGASWDRVRSGLLAVQTAATGVLNAISMARYNATPPTLADGNIAPLQATSVGALKIANADIETAVLDLTTSSGNVSGNTTSTVITGLSKVTAITIIDSLLGATGGTLDVYVQDSPDGGTTWYDYIHYAQIAAAGGAQPIGAYDPTLNDTRTVIGTGTSPALAASAFRGGKPFDQMRLLLVAGAGTSAGASQGVKVVVTRPKA